MDKINTSISGCFILQPNVLEDNRGRFVKTYHKPTYHKLGLALNYMEEYYSVSTRSVLRGLHFQLPPHSHVKCVTCVYGNVFDVVVDIRKSSPTYGQNFALELSAEKGNMIYIPSGLAHGFLTLSEKAVIMYKTTVIHHPESDSGIHWDSCGIKWPHKKVTVSEKDGEAIDLVNFESPFVFDKNLQSLDAVR